MEDFVFLLQDSDIGRVVANRKYGI